MSTATTTQAHGNTTRTPRAAGTEVLRRGMAGALLATAITASAAGLATMSHVDTGAPTSSTDHAVTTPAPATPWLPAIGGVGGSVQLNCSPVLGHWQCQPS